MPSLNSFCLDRDIYLLLEVMKKITLIGFAMGLLSLSLKIAIDLLNRTDDGLEHLRDEYDFIIVGAGTAGSVLAKRLSDNGSFSILVLEAGGPPPWFASVPLAVPFLQQTIWDWKYKTEPQTYSSKGFSKQNRLFNLLDLRQVCKLRTSSMTHKQSMSTSKKQLYEGVCSKAGALRIGGTSSLNYMVHMRGSPKDYDKWSFESGCINCDYQSLLPYFIMTESVDSGMTARPECRGHQGPLSVSSKKDCHTSTLCQAFLNALLEDGYSIGDLNDGLETGAMPAQHNINKGKRRSVYDTYLYPAMQNNRNNLHIATSSLAIKIVMDGKAFPRAMGVIFRHFQDGITKTHTVFARHEIIVSAGVVGSAHLLLLSGIGPKKQLQKHGIPGLANLPVGENLQDHLTLPIYFRLKKDITTNMKKILRLKSLWDYGVHGAGPLSGTGVEGIARIRLPCLVPWNFTNSGAEQYQHRHPCEMSHLILILFNMGTVDSDIYTRNTNFITETFQHLFPGVKNDNNTGFFILLTLTRPHSKGSISLHSDFEQQPVIQPNYLENEMDVYHFINGITFVAALIHKSDFKKFGVTMHLPDLPDCQAYHRAVTDANFLECWVRHAAMTTYHPSGTCRMGENRFQDAVVNSDLRVHGIERLRVVDASVFPSPISGFPHSTVVALAERAVDDILQHPEQHTRMAPSSCN